MMAYDDRVKEYGHTMTNEHRVGEMTSLILITAIHVSYMPLLFQQAERRAKDKKVAGGGRGASHLGVEPGDAPKAKLVRAKARCVREARGCRASGFILYYFISVLHSFHLNQSVDDAGGPQTGI